MYEKNEHLQLKKEQSPMTVQIIPNVGRIKVEKKMVLEKLQPHREGIPQYTPLSSKERKQLEAIQAYGYYRENIFQLEEMLLYRSIFNFYLGDYASALEDMNRSWKQHFAANQQAKRDANGARGGIETDKEEMYGKFPMSQLVSPIASHHSANS